MSETDGHVVAEAIASQDLNNPSLASSFFELIVTVCETVIDKIVARSFDPMGHRRRLTPEEKKSILIEVADQVGFRQDFEILSRLAERRRPNREL